MSNFHTALVDRVHLVDIESTKWAACKAFLRCVGNHANEEEHDLAWPGLELMMLETGMSESALSKTGTLLDKMGWVVRKRRFGKSNMYRLNIAKLQQHQVARPDPKAVHMAEHLPDMLFPGEKFEDLVDAGALADGKPLVPGRSTARQRAARLERAKAAAESQAVDNSAQQRAARPKRAKTEPESPQVSGAVDNSVAEKPQVSPSYVKSTYSKTRSNTSNRRNCSRQIDVTDHVDLTNKQSENRQSTDRQGAARWQAAAEPSACLPAEPSTQSGQAQLSMVVGSVRSAAEQLLAGLALPWPVERSVIRNEAPAIEARLAEGGWSADALGRWIETNVAKAVADFGGASNVRKPMGLLVGVLRDAPERPAIAVAVAAAPARPRCPEHARYNPGSRPDGECSMCWSEREGWLDDAPATAMAAAEPSAPPRFLAG
ncbi:hypothetical protein [Nocardia sp. NPDC059228]|uniref:hypothetical protein n=1 Tax=Nocardia sp. NPDC059228 TaxID=3346777 RepID=UPI0036CCA0A7